MSGNGSRTMLLAPGFLCDQNMWRYMTPAIMGHAERPELGAKLVNSFCRTDPRC